MNTEQKYVGRGISATLTPQAVRKPVKQAPPLSSEPKKPLLSQHGEQKRPLPKLIWDDFGRTGQAQLLHIDLFYADGTKGEINVSSPHIIWGEDIETQCIHMKAYIKSQHERLGIVGYHAHCATIIDGEIYPIFSFRPFDLITNKEL